MKQKFKRGNLVRVLKDDQEVVIEYSYAEEYGGDDVDSYSVIEMDTGNSHAWLQTNELALIERGGEYLIEKAKIRRAETKEQHTNINYILANLEKNLSSDSILYLFELIGHDTSFKRNGEFFVLYSDWGVFQPIFIIIKNAETLEEAQAVFSETGLKHLRIKKVYEAFHENSVSDTLGSLDSLIN